MKEIQGKSILDRVSARFELARIRVIWSRLYLPSKGPKRQTTMVGMASSGVFPAKMVVLYVASVVGLLACKST